LSFAGDQNQNQKLEVHWNGLSRALLPGEYKFTNPPDTATLLQVGVVWFVLAL
jgi:hypothetical protein